MDLRFKYSMNGSDWIGDFKTRKDARAAAIESARQQRETPGVVYVGKVIPADPQTARHAQLIIREMSDRANQAGISNYLTGLSPDQLRDLDQAMTQTLDAWLDRHQLSSAQFTVQAISEYPVPSISMVQEAPKQEIGDLGPPRQVA